MGDHADQAAELTAPPILATKPFPPVTPDLEPRAGLLDRLDLDRW